MILSILASVLLGFTGAPLTSECDLNGPLVNATEIRLRPHGCHEYSIKLEANQFVLVEVAQQGVDVKLQFVGSDGRDAVEPVDSPNRSLGSESIGLIAPTEQDYRLRISWIAAGNATYVSDGRYSIRILASRQALANDRTVLVAASDAFRKAATERRQDMIAAAVGYESILKGAPDLAWIRYRLALVCQQIGMDFRDKGENSDAVTWFRRASELEPQTHLDGESLSDLGLALYRLGQFTESRDALEKSLPIIRGFKNADDFALAHTRLALTLHKLGRLDEAFRTNSSAEAITGVPEATRLTILNNKAILLVTMGRRGEAIEILRPVPDGFLRLQRPREAAFSLSVLMGTLDEIGSRQAASAYMQKATEMGAKWPTGLSRALNLYFLGRLEVEPMRSIGFFEQALTEFQALKNRDSEAVVLKSIGQRYHLAGTEKPSLHPKAEEYFKKAKQLFELNKNEGELAQTLNSIGIEYLETGRFEEAIVQFKQAQSRCRSFA